jgi:hypothetical protein
MEKKFLDIAVKELKDIDNYLIVCVEVLNEDTDNEMVGKRSIQVRGNYTAISNTLVELALQDVNFYQMLLQTVLCTQEEREKVSFKKGEDINLN